MATGRTPYQLSHEIGDKYGTYFRDLFNGTFKEPQADKLQLIARALDCSVEDLLPSLTEQPHRLRNSRANDPFFTRPSQTTPKVQQRSLLELLRRARRIWRRTGVHWSIEHDRLRSRSS